MTKNFLDQAKVASFWQRRTNIKDIKLAANFRDDGRLAYDSEWAKQFIEPGRTSVKVAAMSRHI